MIPADSVLVDYLSGLIDDGNAEEDVLQVTRMILESPAEEDLAALDRLIERLATIVDAKQQASRADGRDSNVSLGWTFGHVCMIF